MLDGRETKKRKFVCCLCGAKCEGFGNNPWPVITDETARCCDDCNDRFVLLARLMRLNGEETR